MSSPGKSSSYKSKVVIVDQRQKSSGSSSHAHHGSHVSDSGYSSRGSSPASHSTQTHHASGSYESKPRTGVTVHNAMSKGYNEHDPHPDYAVPKGRKRSST